MTAAHRTFDDRTQRAVRMTRVSHGVDKRTGEWLLARSDKVRQQIAASLKEKNARPLVLGVFQKTNHCGGGAGVRRNVASMLAAIAEAARQGVQMLAMPEMALQGYFTPISGSVEQAIAANRDLAETVGRSARLRQLQRAAKAAKMVVAFGFGERRGKVVYNSIGVIDADGAWLGVRRKNPLFPWDYETKVFAEPAPSRRCAVFKTRYATVGLNNCFDGEFPETVRRMALDGAQVLLWCNAACGDSTLGTSQRLNQCGAHAQTNGLYVACANCAAPNSSGTSSIYPPTGEPLVVLSPGAEAIGVATINLAWRTDWSIWRDRLYQWTRMDAGARGRETRRRQKARQA